MTLILPTLDQGEEHETAEKRRLESLRALNILDTAAEERFDRCTQLLQLILKVPIALISLVDEERQWFKSACGLGISETPRDISICSHAIENGIDFLVVQDAATDPRFSDNPLVTGNPGIRFYAGAIIRSPDEEPVGMCCVLDYSPRILREHEKLLLEQVAKLIEYELLTSKASKSLTERLQESAFRDFETGLPNLVLFSDRLQQKIEHAELAGDRFLLVLARLNRLDAIEAALGRHAANHLVKLLVERIDSSSTLPFLIGRLREDKLGLIIDLGDHQSPVSVLNSVVASLEQPILLEDHAVQLQLSIGAAIYPDHAETADSLLKRARTALWSNPQSAASTYQLYAPRQSRTARQSFQLEAALERALDRDEMHLVYQPKIALKTRNVCGAEALIRWHSSELGAVPPAKFIPVAEKNGLIHALGRWVIETACAQLAHWRNTGVPLPELAINVTSPELRDPKLLAHLVATLEKHGLTGNELGLELTEGSLVDDIEGAVRIMSLMRQQLGISWSIDDFGTGFSSLAYLRKMPVSLLKIDRAFISNIPAKAEDMKLAQSIISLGHSLGLQVLAEGVETEEQAMFLLHAGCDQAQGYLFGKPMNAASFEQFISRDAASRRSGTAHTQQSSART